MIWRCIGPMLLHVALTASIRCFLVIPSKHEGRGGGCDGSGGREGGRGPVDAALGTCLSPPVIGIVPPGGTGSAFRPVGRDTPERTSAASHPGPLQPLINSPG